ncbi:hypothetical protein [Prauserella rugosa]|uniref:Uncharacterized protein n=1 Tax=Prauserella rugosa TaxID=43354 RepID=A0A660CCP4_9PSEU|nr:hypothetical protein [Prauserella rugosa]TWH18625.1 hypothetical protein JD82_00446 [Prauserella rugosa]
MTGSVRSAGGGHAPILTKNTGGRRALEPLLSSGAAWHGEAIRNLGHRREIYDQL